jgi:hypothetical protein
MDNDLPLDAETRLVMRALCCVVAADGHVRKSEVLVAYDALTCEGVIVPLDIFRTAVIRLCERIYRHGVMVVIEKLRPRLVLLQGTPRAAFLIALHEAIASSDGEVTVTERAAADRIAAILRGDAIGALGTAATPPSRPIRGAEALPYSRAEQQLRALVLTCQGIGPYVRIPLAMVVGTGAGAATLFLTDNAVRATQVGASVFMVIAALLLVTAQQRLLDLIDRLAHFRLEEQLLAAAASTALSAMPQPECVDVANVVICDSGCDDATLAADGEQQGIAAVSAMLGGFSRNPCTRAKTVRRVYDTLRASTHPGPHREACRCTRCGRRIWVPRTKMGFSVICPYCGAYHVAVRDWKPPPLPPPVVVPEFVFGGSGYRHAAPSYSTFGPIQVRGHYRRGKWVLSHSRSRPRRR